MDQSWSSLLNDDVLQNLDFLNLLKFVESERLTKIVYPPEEDVYNAFSIPVQNVKVLILGQDPYHGKGQAHGYSFSVRKGVALPPSLKNIFKEAKIESNHGDLTNWTTQGVMLLNTVLTVEENKPKSHSRKGWQILTRRVLELLIEHNEHIVVMLWGRDAQNQVSGLNFKPTQLVLKAAHPSPLGAHHSAPVPFIGCGHFEQANQHLEKNFKEKIIWTNI
tara:strand:+ start:385 stop:1044 length:660 start_codon:yes stop_codon:yes gene_type:complete